MFGKCKVCSEKDKRIADLQEQILHLRELCVPQSNPYNEPLVSREADATLSASTEMLTVPASQEKEVQEYKKAQEEDEIISERDRLLSGTY